MATRGGERGYPGALPSGITSPLMPEGYRAVMPFSRLSCFLGVPALSIAIALGGCSTIDSSLGFSSKSEGAASLPVQTNGLVVADEPLAARTGAAILTQGGSAADAVTAMFFALSATYPVAAGVGGGGLCLVRDAGGRLQELDFLSHRANQGGAFAVPGAVRGFYDLQKSYGALPWQRDVAPGEAYAATGFPISHVLAIRIASAQNVIRLDASLAAEFLDESGAPKAEGTVVTNIPLSETLGQARLSGADGFYKGAVADQLVAYSAAQGGVISSGELANLQSTASAPRTIRLGGYSVTLPGAATGAGAFANALLNNMAQAGIASDAAILGALRQSLAVFGVASLPADLGATGFAAVDTKGQAAACAVTLNGPFGSGHTAGATGVTLAASPAGPAGISSAFLTPLLASDNSGQVALAGAGTGGPNGSAGIAYAMLKLAGGGQLGRPSDLRSTGAAPYATVNAISCQSGICVALSDPGGFGLGAAADQPAPAQ
jgi:gamma-glutamyltranspeptidase / glutathione hydrolase